MIDAPAFLLQGRKKNGQTLVESVCVFNICNNNKQHKPRIKMQTITIHKTAGFINIACVGSNALPKSCQVPTRLKGEASIIVLLDNISVVAIFHGTAGIPLDPIDVYHEVSYETILTEAATGGYQAVAKHLGL